MPVSSRNYPFLRFAPERPCGNIILEVEGLSKTIDGESILDNVSFTVNNKDKIAFMGNNSLTSVLGQAQR